MTFLQLQYFQMVTQLGSIAAAAEILNVTATSLSKTIRQLEAELGVELFSREGRRITLNESGTVFLRYTIEILDAMAAARLELSGMPETHQRVLRLRLDVLLDEPGRIPVELKSTRPDLVLDIMPPTRAGGVYDLRFFSTLNELGDQLVEHICTERWVAALPLSHPLASRRDIRFRELADTPFILFRGDGHDEALRSMCEAADIHPRIAMAFSEHSYGGLHRAICNGLGCSIVPERVWKSEWAPGPVALVPFSDVVRKRHVYCSHPDDRPITDDGRFVIDYLREKLNRL